MTRFLRTASLGRVLSSLAAAVALVAAGTAIAVAATGGGPVPASRPLAQALHAALSAPPVDGVTADVTFTNHLIDAASLQGSDPLLSGATGRLWLGHDRLRLELQSAGGGGDAELVVNGTSVWAYDPASNTVYRATLPAARSSANTERAGLDHVPSLAAITRVLGRLSRHLSLSGAQGTDVGGKGAYSVRIAPRLAGGELDSVKLAWDALRGVPLSLAVYAKGNPDPVLALSATNVSYGPVSAADFAAAPPAGATVVRLGSSSSSKRGGDSRAGGQKRAVTGVTQVAKRLSFPLDAPQTLNSLQRSSVRLLGSGGHAGALVTYGHDLNGVAVIELPAAPKSSAAKSTASAGGDSHQALSLPTVTLPGATGQELDTALGSVVRFTRGSISYTVLGSVGRAAIDAAARGL